VERKRKNFGYSTTKVYQGKKTVGIHFEPADIKQCVKLARGILQAIEYGIRVRYNHFHI